MRFLTRGLAVTPKTLAAVKKQAVQATEAASFADLAVAVAVRHLVAQRDTEGAEALLHAHKQRRKTAMKQG